MSELATADLISFLIRSRQDREFLPEPVSPQAVEDILEVARWTGSSMNRQDWVFVGVQDPDVIARIGSIAKHGPHLGKAPFVVVIAMGGNHAEFDGSDESRAAERIILAARAHGLGAGLAWIRTDEQPAIRELLGLPAGAFVRTGIAIGHPVPRERKPAGQARKPASEVIRRIG